MLGLVEAVEPNPPAGIKPLHWRILTSLPVDTCEDAQDVVRTYRLRWRIEEVFRSLKRDGLALEETQVRDKKHLFHLSALALGAAVRIIQLVDARDGSSRPMSDALDPELQDSVALLVQSREGKTEKQKNPHPQVRWLGSLGSLPDTAAGTATTNHRVPRPWQEVGSASRLLSRESSSPARSDFRESRSPQGEVGDPAGEVRQRHFTGAPGKSPGSKGASPSRSTPSRASKRSLVMVPPWAENPPILLPLARTR